MAKKKTKKLTANRELFCREYIISRSPSDAYKKAYPNCKSGHRQAGNRLLTNVDVKDFIKTLQKPALEKFEVTQERIIKELAAIAFVDLGDMYDDNGSLLAVKDMPENVRRAICSINTGRDTLLGKGGKVKILNKNTALELLGKTNLLNMFSDKVKLEVDSGELTNEGIREAKADITKDILKELEKR